MSTYNPVNIPTYLIYVFKETITSFYRSRQGNVVLGYRETLYKL